MAGMQLVGVDLRGGFVDNGDHKHRTDIKVGTDKAVCPHTSFTQF